MPSVIGILLQLDELLIHFQPLEVRLEVAVVNHQPEIEELEEEMLVIINVFEIEYFGHFHHVDIPEVAIVPILSCKKQTCKHDWPPAGWQELDQGGAMLKQMEIFKELIGLCVHPIFCRLRVSKLVDIALRQRPEVKLVQRQFIAS